MTIITTQSPEIPAPGVPNPIEQGLIDNGARINVSSLLDPENPAMKLFARIQEMAGPMGAAALEVQRQAETDELTGLLNRRGIMHRLDSILRSRDFDPERRLVMFADLDLFKEINDVFGHDEGDSVLREVGSRLSLREGDVVGRLGGDEFIVIVDRKKETGERRLGSREGKPRRQDQTKIQTEAEIVEGFSRRLSADVLVAGMNARDKWAKSGTYDKDLEQYHSIAVSVGTVKLDPTISAEENIKVADKKMYENKRKSGHPIR